jgi:outer membrane lipoprotein-sorting protein
MRRTLLPLLCSCVLLGSARAADDDAKAILAKAIKAHGGEEKLAKFQAGQSKAKGKINLPVVGESEYTEETSFMLPDKFRSNLELDVNGMKVKIITIANGDKISIDANGTEVPITDAIKKSLEEARYVMKVARLSNLLKDKAAELTALGEVKVEGKPAVGVRVTSKGHKDISMYFDKETHLLAKMEYRSVDAQSGKEVTEERIVLEYQKKDDNGFVLPKKVLVKRDGEKFTEADVSEAKYLEKLDDSVFNK